MPGPQPGAGMLAVTDWWLTKTLVVEDVAAAAPATTTNKAMMRIASFIVGYPFRFGLADHVFPAPNYRIQKSTISTVISFT